MTDSSHSGDARQIEAVMQAYIEGGRTGNVDTLRPIFHELATICGYVGPDLFAGPIEMFYDWHTENGPAPDVAVGDMRIDVEGTAASRTRQLDRPPLHRLFHAGRDRWPMADHEQGLLPASGVNRPIRLPFSDQVVIQGHNTRGAIMRTIPAAASLAVLIALATLAPAQSNPESPDPDARPEPLDGRVIRAEKRSLDAIPVEILAPGITRQVVHGTQSTFSRWQLKAGSSVPLHHHVNEQITWIVSGRAEVRSGGRTHELGAGEIMVFAPNVEHAFTILEDTVAIDVFSPARQDWIDAAAEAAEQP